MDDTQFWDKVHQAAKKATWAYLATASGDRPKVRVIHPAFEGERVWIATGRNSAKARQIAGNPHVELFYQVGPDFVHLTVTGTARMVGDAAEKSRVWNGNIFDYDLAQFWPGGPSADDFGLILLTPSRVELTGMAEMMAGTKPLLWRARR